MVEQLKEARDDLTQAEKTADDDVSETIRETADAYRDYVVGDHEPDHTIIDQHLNTLRQLQQDVSGDTKTRIDRALEATEEYRKTLEQA